MRIPFTISLLLITSLPAAADELQRCAPIPEATARLACFDALAARLRAAPPAAVAAPVAAAPAVPTAPSMAQRVDAFGVQPVAPKDELQAVESQIEGLVDGWEAGTVFTLANGQRWMISDGSRAAMNLRNPKVVIRRGALGSFRIEFEGSKQSARVKRL